MTLSDDDGDLVYVIRASAIDDAALMRKVSVEQLVEFLLYVKEVHQLVLDARAARTGRLHTVVFYEKAMLLAEGGVLEYDAPAKLLAKRDGAFRKLAEETGDLMGLVAAAQD